MPCHLTCLTPGWEAHEERFCEVRSAVFAQRKDFIPGFYAFRQGIQVISAPVCALDDHLTFERAPLFACSLLLAIWTRSILPFIASESSRKTYL